MSIRSISAGALAGVMLLAGCKDSPTIPHTPTHIVIVSGGNQTGDLSAALPQPLVVQALDGAGKPVSGVAVTWSVTGGGAVNPATSTTDNDGKASVTWTLSPTAGTQVATATSAQITGVSVSFIANNGATISGTVAINTSQSQFAPSPSLSPGHGTLRATSAVAALPTPMYSRDRIIVGFRNDRLGVDAAASIAYRAMPAARATAAKIQQRVASFDASLPISRAEISPALVAARMRVDDPSRIEEVMAALRKDPNVAYVERDGWRSVRTMRRPSALEPIITPASLIAGRAAGASFAAAPARRTSATAAAAAVATRVPNDPNLPYQYWNYNMIGLPRAWAITTGSAAVTVAVLDMGVRFDDVGIAGNLTADGYDFVSKIPFFTEDGTAPLCAGGVASTIDGDGDGADTDPTDPNDIFNPDPDLLGCWFQSTAGDHGLWTSGIIGELGNNAAGGTGINWTVKIRPIRVLGIDGSGSTFDISQGILYAAGLPATGAGGVVVQGPLRSPIISMSFGGQGSSTTEQNAVAAAVNAGSLLIASSGNDASDLPNYPAAYPGVMAVAAVGPDGTIASYSTAGADLSVAAPGGEPRLDSDFDNDTGGDWVWGRWWDFTRNRVVFTAAVGTSASAPHVSGVAALILAQNPTLTAAQLRQRIEQFATRPAGTTRSNNYGWGIVNAYNSLTQTNGPPTQTYVRLIDATSGAVVKTAAVNASGGFTLSRLTTGAYFLQAGDDESGDATIGQPGRRFAWAGGFGTPTVFNVTATTNTQTAAILLGIPTETEPNDDVTHANLLSVGSYVTGTIVTPDVRDVYAVTIPTAGTYTFETSGVVGTCGFGLELDTILSVASAAGASVGTSNDVTTATGLFCSRVSATLTPGIYYATVSGATFAGVLSHGRYRLEVRSGQ